MKVLLLGANGYLGPHVIEAIGGEHELLITDLDDNGASGAKNYRRVDISDLDQVVDAASGMDVIINLSVLRYEPQIAFDVNARGCYNVMVAATRHGIRRIINTGPHFTITGATYEQSDYGIIPDSPTQSGTNLYAITKSLGQEICRVFTENYDLYVIMLMFYNFRDTEYSEIGRDINPLVDTPFIVSWKDAGSVFGHALKVDLEKLESRCEQFFVLADTPHGKFSNEKTKRVLGWQPTDSLDLYWKK